MGRNEKLLLQAIRSGHKSTPEICTYLGKTASWVCKAGKVLEQLGLIYIEKIISKPNIYREVNNNDLPAHDPFGLCRTLRTTEATTASILPSQTAKQFGERRRHCLDDAQIDDKLGSSHQRVACTEYGKPTELRDII